MGDERKSALPPFCVQCTGAERRSGSQKTRLTWMQLCRLAALISCELGRFSVSDWLMCWFDEIKPASLNAYLAQDASQSVPQQSHGKSPSPTPTPRRHWRQTPRDRSGTERIRETERQHHQLRTASPTGNSQCSRTTTRHLVRDWILTSCRPHRATPGRWQTRLVLLLSTRQYALYATAKFINMS